MEVKKKKVEQHRLDMLLPPRSCWTCSNLETSDMRGGIAAICKLRKMTFLYHPDDASDCNDYRIAESCKVVG